MLTTALCSVRKEMLGDEADAPVEARLGLACRCLVVDAPEATACCGR